LNKASDEASAILAKDRVKMLSGINKSEKSAALHIFVKIIITISLIKVEKK